MAVLGLMLYCLALPLFMHRFGHLLPECWRTCASLRWFGRPCPLCGMTRGVFSAMHGDLATANSYNLFCLPALALALAEIVFRLFLLAKPPADAKLRLISAWDLRAHVLLGVGYAAYCLVFYLA